jgi:hypothetical protein
MSVLNNVRNNHRVLEIKQSGPRQHAIPVPDGWPLRKTSTAGAGGVAGDGLESNEIDSNAEDHEPHE